MTAEITISGPGVYDLPEHVYHSDPCPEPSFSTSIGKEILKHTPRHAWIKHPRLNPSFEPENRYIYDLGSAAHKMLLGVGQAICRLGPEHKNFQTNAAKAARDEAYAARQIPILEKDWTDVRAMAGEARAQLDLHEDGFIAFRNGKAEQTLIWPEGDVWCRCLLDWLPSGGNVFFDYKTTTDASPDQWGQRQMFETGCDIQAAFYRRGIKAVLGIEDAHFLFAVQENKPPYGLAVIAPSPAALGIADRKVDEALGWWRWCLKHDKWPGYPKRTCYVDPPPWQENRWLAREERNALIAESGEDVRKLLIDWQSPLAGAAE